MLMEPEQDKRTYQHLVYFMRYTDHRHRLRKEMFFYTVGLKEWAVWHWVLSKKSENQLYSHTSPHYDRASLQKAICSKLLDNAPTLISHYCRKSENTHMHASKKERPLPASKHVPHCSIKNTFLSAPKENQRDQCVKLERGNRSSED